MPASSYVGTFSRPDTSGIRGKGVGRKSYQDGGDDYPYDKQRGKWGEPLAYSRDNAGHGPSYKIPTPKGVSADDDRWDDGVAESLEDDELCVRGNISFDPTRMRSKFGIENEALGVPFNVDRAGRGTKAGTSRGWSGAPTGDMWDDHMDAKELSSAGLDEFMGGLAASGNVWRRGYSPTGKDEEPQPPKRGAPFSLGGNRRFDRGSPGMSWKESLNIHGVLLEAFVSLADTPESPIVPNQPIADVDLEFSFTKMADAMRLANSRNKTYDDISDLMASVDPGGFISSLKKDAISDTYVKWSADLLANRDGDHVDKMADRILKVIGSVEDEA